jgi:hypothetical protein
MPTTADLAAKLDAAVVVPWQRKLLNRRNDRCPARLAPRPAVRRIEIDEGVLRLAALPLTSGRAARRPASRQWVSCVDSKVSVACRLLSQKQVCCCSAACELTGQQPTRAMILLRARRGRLWLCRLDNDFDQVINFGQTDGRVRCNLRMNCSKKRRISLRSIQLAAPWLRAHFSRSRCGRSPHMPL